MPTPPTQAISQRLRRPSSSSAVSQTPGSSVVKPAAATAAEADTAAEDAEAEPGNYDDDAAAAAADEEEDEEDAGGGGGGGGESSDLPLTMTASVMLSQLPRDASAALAEAGAFPPDAKVVVRFKPVGGSAPPLRRELCKISAAQRFEAVVAYLRRTLRVAPSDGVFLYVNSTFAPALDEIVGNLHRCFKDSNGQLNISYSMAPAFG